MTHRNKMLRFGSVREYTGLSRSTIDRLEREGKFPRRRQLSAKAVAWIAGEIEDWCKERTTSKTQTA